jgi:hypothetical protein
MNATPIWPSNKNQWQACFVFTIRKINKPPGLDKNWSQGFYLNKLGRHQWEDVLCLSSIIVSSSYLDFFKVFLRFEYTCSYTYKENQWPYGTGPMLTTGAFIWTNLVDTHGNIFHGLYLSSSFLGFLKEDLFSFHYIHIRKVNDPLGGANFDPRALIWTNLVDTLYKMFHVKYVSSS